MKKYRVNVKNFNKPTPPKAQLIGNIALVLIPVWQVALMGAPEGMFSPKMLWILSTFASTTLATIKICSKFFVSKNGTEEETVE